MHCMEHIELNISEQRYICCRPQDLESFWEQMEEQDLDQDERLPYWVEIWPASILLAKWILKQKPCLQGKNCLDLGCGLGLTSLAAADCGARVLGLDYESQALYYARQNAKLNKSPAHWVLMDWRQPAFKPHSFSFIWGADILYESRFFLPLLKLFAHTLAPGGQIWLSSPERDVARPFWDLLQASGWCWEHMQQESVPYQGQVNMQIHIWKVTRTETALA
ncbi:MAG: methyltransferase domain-containing protein [Desulfohalobiaceae bacterium]